MSDILVVKVNMFCRSRELNDIRRYILSQIEKPDCLRRNRSGHDGSLRGFG